MGTLALPVDVLLLVLVASGYYIAVAPINWNIRAIATLLVLVYLAAHLMSVTSEDTDKASQGNASSRWLLRTKLLVVVGLISLTVIYPVWTHINARHQTSPVRYVHDGVVQVEEALKFMLDGQDPYEVTYENTPLADIPWRGVNPALHNLAYLPFMFISGLPLYYLSSATIGWYDQRFVYVIAFMLALWTFWKLGRSRTFGLMALIVVGLNPYFVKFLAYGRNDVMIVALIGLSLYALSRADWRWRYEISGLVFGLACATKQIAWLLLPFLLLYIWGALGGSGVREPRDVGTEVVRRWLAPVALTASVIILPFFLWNPARFLEGTYFYLSGSATYNYPIKAAEAYGFHVLLVSPDVRSALDTLTSGALSFLRPAVEALLVENKAQSYPFWIFQVLFALPVLILALRRQWRQNNIQTALTGYAVFLFAYAYFSRFFHDNYIGYLITIFVVAHLIKDPLADSKASTATD